MQKFIFFIITVLLLALPSTALAALTFGALTTDRVAITGSASINDLAEFTGVMWVYPTTFTALRRMWSIGTTAQKRVTIDDTLGAMSILITRATTNASAATVTTMSLNTWNFVAFTFDTTNAPKLYLGSLTSAVAEVSYSGTPTAGVGTVSTESSGNMNWGNRVGSNVAFQGRIATGMHFNRALTLGELRSLQFHPRVLSGTTVYHQLGFAGTGTQPDWSGNANSGTVTGATVSDHVPLGPPFGFSDEGAYYAKAPEAGDDRVWRVRLARALAPLRTALRWIAGKT